jgi:hypothetical protein
MKDEERLKRRGRSGDNHIAGRHRLGEGEREREKKKKKKTGSVALMHRC